MSNGRVIGLAAALLLASAIGWAGAEEIKGKIKSLDTSERMFALEDGTRVWVAEGLTMKKLKKGVSVRATCETRDGNRIATRIEAEETE
jgi:hypothetical protein